MRGLLLVLVLSGTATADVTWTAPRGCPSAADVRAKVTNRLGELSLDDVAIDVTVTRAGGKFSAAIDAGELSGNGRSLTAAKCSELADAVALIVARLASEAVREKPPAPTTIPAMPVAAPRTEELTLTLPVEQPHGAAWTAGFRALALTGIGMTPEVGVGADVSAFLQRDTTFVEVGYARWVPRPMQILATADGAVQFDLQLVAARIGWASTKMPLRGWGGLEVGQMHGAGAALRTPESGVGRWVAISSGFGVGWPISPRTRLVGTFEVAVPVQRAKFQFMDGSEVREPAPISARSALGLEVAWR